MKTNIIILKFGLIAWGLTVISCDKQETETNFPKEAVLEEGFISTTGNSNSEIEISSQEPNNPLLHMSYDASLSEAEATAKFQKEVAKFEKKSGQTNKGGWIEYFILTKTGDRNYAQTDARVTAVFSFRTDGGLVWTPELELNNPGDDRESGRWDYYFFKEWVDNNAYWWEYRTNWVELRYAHLRLYGTDGWYLERFSTEVKRYRGGGIASEGATYISTSPGQWLDNENPNPTFLDYYGTGEVGEGRITVTNF